MDAACNCKRNVINGGNEGMQVSPSLHRFIRNLDALTEILGSETDVTYGATAHNRNMEEATFRCNAGADLETTTKKKMEEKEALMLRERTQKRDHRKSASSDFPPPLTVLSGKSRLRLVSQRESGRLLLFPVKPLVVEAQREEGSLKLRLFSGGELSAA